LTNNPAWGIKPGSIGQNSKRKDVIPMVCATVKQGVECAFMTKTGCGFNGGNCHTAVEQCDGCQKVIDLESGRYCMVFPDPAIKWRLGTCNMATHVKATNGKAAAKLNPLKASKRRAH